MSSPPKGGSQSTSIQPSESSKSQSTTKRQSSPLADGDGRPGPSGSKSSKAHHTKEGAEESSVSSTNLPPLAPKDNPRDKSCCFCWCCCCSCSCLSVHNRMKEKTNKMHKMHQITSSNHNGSGTESPPTLEEIRTWSESFDRLMRCTAGRELFREFLRCEYSEENMMFWLACEELKKEKNPEQIEEKARGIYEDFVSILSPKEVSLDSKVREIVNRNMVSPTVNTFDEAQLQIYTLMHRDSYPRFVCSPLYRRTAQLSPPTPPTRKTSISVG